MRKQTLARQLELHVPSFNNQQLPFVLARNARWKTNISGISGHFCKLANYGVINPPSRPPRGMHLPTPARLVGRKSGLRRNPGPEGRCAKTQSVKVGALQFALRYGTGNIKLLTYPCPHTHRPLQHIFAALQTRRDGQPRRSDRPGCVAHRLPGTVSAALACCC